MKKSTVLSLCALVAFSSQPRVARAQSATPMLTKIMVCKTQKDSTANEPHIRELSLYAERADFEAGGAGFISFAAGNPHLPSMEMEVGAAVPIRVDGDKVSLNLLGSAQQPQVVSFSAKALLATMDPKATPLRIAVSGGAGGGVWTLACEVPMKYPFSLLEDGNQPSREADRSAAPKAVGAEPRAQRATPANAGASGQNALNK